MKGNELIEKIINKEIKSGTMIKMKSNYPGLEWEKELCFNGNWFSEGKYEPGCSRYNDIILHLCSEYTSFEIIEEPQEHKIPEKFKVHSLGDKNECGHYVSSPFPTEEEMMNKINEILDYLEEIE